MRDTEYDMHEELFIDLGKQECEFRIPQISKRRCAAIVHSKKDQETRDRGLVMLVEWYWFGAIRSMGKYDASARQEIIKIISDFSKKYPNTSLEEGVILGRQGGRCERAGDYQSALEFYRASLGFPISIPDLRYFRLNNLGFCLNFFRKFDEAEEFLRAAVAMNPERYNAWKNLGVTLEHQGKYEEAAECYQKAAICSRGERRSIRHFFRLLKRQPVLREKYSETNFYEQDDE